MSSYFNYTLSYPTTYSGGQYQDYQIQLAYGAVIHATGSCQVHFANTRTFTQQENLNLIRTTTLRMVPLYNGVLDTRPVSLIVAPTASFALRGRIELDVGLTIGPSLVVNETLLTTHLTQPNAVSAALNGPSLIVASASNFNFYKKTITIAASFVYIGTGCYVILFPDNSQGSATVSFTNTTALSFVLSSGSDLYLGYTNTAGSFSFASPPNFGGAGGLHLWLITATFPIGSIFTVPTVGTCVPVCVLVCVLVCV